MGFGGTPDKNGTVIMMTVPFLSFKEKYICTILTALRCF